MPEISLNMLLILCPLIFLSCFVDAVAGGGGVISLPAYLFIGLPSHYALASNKFSAFVGGISATLKYITSGKINFSAAIWSAVGALIGASIGSGFALFIASETLKTIMLVALPIVAVFLVWQKDKMISPKPVERTNIQKIVISFLIGLGMGIYDGLIGPGTGTFMIMLFSALLGYDLLTSSGCAKLSNLASNMASVVIFLCSGKIVYILAIPAAVCGSLGAYFGAKYAIKGGSKKVQYFMFVVLIMLFVKFAFDLFA